MVEENKALEAQALKHVSVMKAVFGSEAQASIEGTRIIEAGYAPEPAIQDGAEPTVVSFASGNAVTALFQAAKPVAVLDPASYRFAGGGYLRGWHGFEEDLCDEGNLFVILEAFQKEFYAPNKQTSSGDLYTSRALSIPDVVFTRQGEIVKASVVAMAAPNRKRALSRNRSERECDLAMAERVDAAMRLLAELGAATVVLPAFGCAQGNDAAQVAKLFHEWIAAPDGAIAQVVFAIRNGADAAAFKAAFADRWHEEKPAVVEAPVVEEDEGEEDDWERYRISE
jgi:uncharacterized protein (TIGR02452 family)